MRPALVQSSRRASAGAPGARISSSTRLRSPRIRRGGSACSASEIASSRTAPLAARVKQGTPVGAAGPCKIPGAGKSGGRLSAQAHRGACAPAGGRSAFSRPRSAIYRQTVRALAAILALSFGASAAPFGWTGAAGGGHWADGGNWSGGRAPPDDGTADVTFSAGGTVQLDGVRVVSTLAVSSSANVTLQAGAEPRSALVLRGAALSRAARGRLTFQVPVLAAGAVAISGFESQSTVANAT